MMTPPFGMRCSTSSTAERTPDADPGRREPDTVAPSCPMYTSSSLSARASSVNGAMM